jgi:polyphosphate kinase 2 (PPK2 family)
MPPETGKFFTRKNWYKIPRRYHAAIFNREFYSRSIPVNNYIRHALQHKRCNQITESALYYKGGIHKNRFLKLNIFKGRIAVPQVQDVNAVKRSVKNNSIFNLTK